MLYFSRVTCCDSLSFYLPVVCVSGTFQLLGHKADNKVPDYDKFYEQAEVMFGAKKEDSFRYNVRDKLSKAQPSLVSLQADSADLTSDKCANLIGNLEKVQARVSSLLHRCQLIVVTLLHTG